MTRWPDPTRPGKIKNHSKHIYKQVVAWSCYSGSIVCIQSWDRQLSKHQTVPTDLVHLYLVTFQRWNFRCPTGETGCICFELIPCCFNTHCALVTNVSNVCKSIGASLQLHLYVCTMRRSCNYQQISQTQS